MVAALVIGGAATGPLFLRASAESVLHDTLRQASLPSARVVSDRLDAPLSDGPLAVVGRVSASRLRRLPTLDRLLGPPVPALMVGAAVGRSGVAPVHTLLVWRHRACRHVLVVGLAARKVRTRRWSARRAGIWVGTWGAVPVVVAAG